MSTRKGSPPKTMTHETFSLHLIATVIVLLSAVLHAGWNALIKSTGCRSTGVVVLALTGALALLGTLTLRSAAFPDTRALWWSLLAGMFEASYFLTLVWCLHLGPLAQVYPFSRGGSLVVAWPVSILLLAEPVHAIHLAGAGIVAVGLLLSGRSSGEGGSKRGYWFALFVCAGSIAAYHLVYKAALLLGAHPLAVFAVSMAVAAPVNVAWNFKLVRSEWKQQRWAILIPASLMCALSFYLALLGLKIAGTGWVLTLRNTSVVVALVLAWKMGEKVPAQRAWGTVLIAIGAVVLGMQPN